MDSTTIDRDARRLSRRNMIQLGGVAALAGTGVALSPGRALAKPNPGEGPNSSAPTAASHNLKSYVDEDGHYSLMAFIPKRLRAAIRDRSSTVDVSKYFQECIDAVRDERDKGYVSLPMGTIRLESTVQARDGVSIRGSGSRASLIETADCDGITISFTAAEGSLVLRDFGIHGVSGTNTVGIHQVISDNDADENYGITLSDLFITNVHTIARFRSARLLWMERVWGQICNTGINMAGKVLVARVNNCEFVRRDFSVEDPFPSGDNTGLIIDAHNFTEGSGFVPSEGVQVNACQFYGFGIGVDVRWANVVNLDMLDIDARQYGITFTTVQLQFNISKTFIVMQSADAQYGIHGRPLGGPIASKVNIDKWSILGTPSAASCGGIKINTSGAGNQNHVTIRDGFTFGLMAEDVLVENAGETNIENNRFMSSTTTHSIRVPNVLSGTVYIDKNTCQRPVAFQAAEAASGEIRMGVNTIEGVRQHGAQHVPTVASAASLVLPQGANIFHVSGTTNITSIAAAGWAGREVTLIFDDTLTLVDGSNLKLAGNYVTAPNGTIRLVCDGTNWYAAGGPSANG